MREGGREEGGREGGREGRREGRNRGREGGGGIVHCNNIELLVAGNTVGMIPHLVLYCTEHALVHIYRYHTCKRIHVQCMYIGWWM